MKKISIFDLDLNSYLSEDTCEKVAFTNYLHFRNEEFLGEWWEGNEHAAPVFNKIFQALTEKDFNKMYDSLFNLWVDEVVTTESGKEFIEEDIYACNFKIEAVN